MKRITLAIAVAVVLMVGTVAQAHENPLNPGHKQGLEVGIAGCKAATGEVLLSFKESVRECSWNECHYTCLYRVWGDWEGGRYAGPPNWNRCHIRSNNVSEFHVTKPSWVTGEWGVYVRDGWGQKTIKCD